MEDHACDKLACFDVYPADHPLALKDHGLQLWLSIQASICIRAHTAQGEQSVPVSPTIPLSQRGHGTQQQRRSHIHPVVVCCHRYPTCNPKWQFLFPFLGKAPQPCLAWLLGTSISWCQTRCVSQPCPLTPEMMSGRGWPSGQPKICHWPCQN